MTKLFLVRTGKVKTNENIFLGWLNPKLDKKGLNDAKKVSKKLIKEKIDFAFCSDQLRGKQALIEIVKFHKKTKIIIDPRIRERNYGVFSGHSKEIFKKYFPKTYNEIHNSYKGKVPKGENFDDVAKRVFHFMNDLIKFMHYNKGNVLICAHKNSSKLISAYLEDLNEKDIEKVNQDSFEVKKYELILN